MTSEQDLVLIEGIAASSHPFDSRYGRVQLTDEQLEEIAASMSGDEVPATVAQHNPSRPMSAVEVQAWVDDHEGAKAVFYRMKVDRATWEAFEAERESARAPGGFSITLTEPVRQVEGDWQIGVIGDAADFTDQELVELASELGAEVPVSRLYQFSLEAEVVRFILVAVAGGAVWDLSKAGVRRVVQRLIAKAAQTERDVAIDVDVHQTDGRSARGRVMIRGEGNEADALSALQRIFERGTS